MNVCQMNLFTSQKEICAADNSYMNIYKLILEKTLHELKEGYIYLSE